MKSNYVIQAEINIKQHSEWNITMKANELKQAYEKENKTCFVYNNILYVMPIIENKPIKIIYV